MEDKHFVVRANADAEEGRGQGMAREVPDQHPPGAQKVVGGFGHRRAGLTPGVLQEKLIKLYADQISSKEVVVTVESSSFPVFVTGSVIHPGKINTDHPMTALEAVMEAGGFDYNTANMSSVKISRMENGMMKSYKLDLKKALDGDKNTKPFYLKPNDILFVPERLQIF